MEQLKKALKMCTALLLALVIAITATGTTAEAASVKVTKKNSGKVSCVYYKGAKAKKAKVSISSSYKYSLTYSGYDVYDVTVTINRPSLSKNDIIKTVKESRKKGSNIMDYALVVIDGNGNQLSIPWSLYTSYSQSSSSKTLRATSGNTRYSIYGWMKKTVYTGTVYVPRGTTGVYVGVAGLRNGQIKKSVYNKWKNGSKTYYTAGFGKSKKGYVLAGQIA